MFGHSVESFDFFFLFILCINLNILSSGILLWEIFSLGQVPYPGIAASEQLFQRILDGYRMDKPLLASQEIFDVMLSCWNYTPETRPLFQELQMKIESLMDEEVKDVRSFNFKCEPSIKSFV